MGNVKWDVRNGAEYWKREMGSEDCECSHHTSHMASEKWEVGLKRGFPFLKYPTQISHQLALSPELDEMSILGMTVHAIYVQVSKSL
jgi:hypothetical protein